MSSKGATFFFLKLILIKKPSIVILVNISFEGISHEYTEAFHHHYYFYQTYKVQKSHECETVQWEKMDLVLFLRSWVTMVAAQTLTNCEILFLNVYLTVTARGIPNLFIKMKLL